MSGKPKLTNLLCRLNITVSFLFAQSIGLGVYFLDGNASWRLLFGLQCIPAVMMLTLSLWIPESPRWLCLRGRHEEALEVLQKLHADVQGSRDDEILLCHQEYALIRAQIEDEKTTTASWRRILTTRSYVKRFALICAFFFFQQSVNRINPTRMDSTH